MQFQDLNVVVWNTQVKASRSEFNSKNWRFCKKVIYSLILQNIDLIGLIEVDETCVGYLNSIFERFNLPYKVADGTQQRRNTSFDTCIIYRTDKFLLSKTEHQQDCENTDLYVHGKQSKSGQKFVFFDIMNSQFLSFVMIHWPSPMTQGIEKLRIKVADNLRRHLDVWLQENNNIIIAGDFNTEPFCDSLTEQLYFLREPNATKRGPNGFEYFFNPSWGFLNIPPPVYNPYDYEILGTYFYKGDRAKHWHNFDQVIFSKNLIDGDVGWKYSKESLKILGYFDITNQKERWSDHLPIKFSLKWVS